MTQLVAFHPAGIRWEQAAMPPGRAARVRWAMCELRTFYRDPSSWLVVLTTAVVLCYGGGLALFWYHSVALGEGGPAISWYAHWLLDSSFAFIGLTPALIALVPLAAVAADRLAGPHSERIPWLYVTILGGLFAILTTPGPIGHDKIVGRGTWIAHQATVLIGDPSAPLRPIREYPIPVELAQQFAAGVPIYLAATALSLLLIRKLLPSTHNSP
jgi:hypothetical protein